MVILALITRGSGGYKVTIKDIVNQPEHLVVHVDEQAPGPNCGVILMFTQNYHIVKLPRIGKEVVFMKNVREQLCR